MFSVQHAFDSASDRKCSLQCWPFQFGLVYDDDLKGPWPNATKAFNGYFRPRFFIDLHKHYFCKGEQDWKSLLVMDCWKNALKIDKNLPQNLKKIMMDLKWT